MPTSASLSDPLLGNPWNLGTFQKLMARCIWAGQEGASAGTRRPANQGQHDLGVHGSPNSPWWG